MIVDIIIIILFIASLTTALVAISISGYLIMRRRHLKKHSEASKIIERAQKELNNGESLIPKILTRRKS